METALDQYVARQNAEAEKALLYELVRDGDLSVDAAAKHLKMTAEQIQSEMQLFEDIVTPG